MNQNRRKPVPGEFYRHFKNKLYQIVAMAFDSENGEELVVYQALYGDFRVWVRPLSMFMEAVDREKYPDAPQEYRFERVSFHAPENQSAGHHAAECRFSPDPAARDQNTAGLWFGEAPGEFLEGTETADLGADQEQEEMNPHLLSFFEAMDVRDYDQMLEFLAKMRDTATEKEIGHICMVLDMEIPTGGRQEQIGAIRNQIYLRKKFDGERLR